jgi:lysyl-tRNA synthetase, class II
MSLPPSILEDNDQTRARREHLESIRALVGNAYPNKFRRTNVVAASAEGEDTITAVVTEFRKHEPAIEAGARPAPEQLEATNAELNKIEVRVSGRLATPPRVMGRVAFVHLSDGRERLQIYVRRQEARAVSNDTGRDIDMAEGGWQLFQLLDHGDFVGVAGYLFVTKTGELSVHVRELQFLAKALQPMPDKMHGVSDPEIRQRQRYVDLLAGSLKVKTDAEENQEAEDGESKQPELSTREVFERRSRMITEMRRYLDAHGYVEVETPMLTPIASGAAARPFKTHHNALDIDLYARIAPELYLKRLLVGGFERVYELNRNFRNEGIGYRWNPEFTMLEFYCAYMDVNGMMDFCEEMLRKTVLTVTGGTIVSFGEFQIDFGPKFARLSMKDAIAQYWPSNYRQLGNEEFNAEWLDDPLQVRRLVLLLSKMDERVQLTLQGSMGFYTHDDIEKWCFDWKDAVWSEVNQSAQSAHAEETGRSIELLFERFVEKNLNQLTYITNFPKAISPLSKASPTDSTIAERFELYVPGMEIANGFSELNDPVEQYERFEDQTRQRERGDDEAMRMDEDYVRALAYGMPPAAGIGIGVDRLAMLLTNRRTIREVILFPHMRPRAAAAEETAVDVPLPTEEPGDSRADG